jgi:chromosome segregation ATPase
MSDLKFQQLDEQVSLVRRRFEKFQREREEWTELKKGYEEKLRALEEEIGRLAEGDRGSRKVISENEQYRKSQEIVREQVLKMLERIDTFAGS